MLPATDVVRDRDNIVRHGGDVMLLDGQPRTPAFMGRNSSKWIHAIPVATDELRVKHSRSATAGH